MATLVAALGGNAIKRADEAGTAQEQIRNLEMSSEQLVRIVEAGYGLVITHGNGPQIGNLLLQQEEARGLVPPQPLDILGSMTQGQIGYMLQQTLGNLLRKLGRQPLVITLTSRVLVNKGDAEFTYPSKPIGPFYGWAEAHQLATEKGYVVRRVLPKERKPYRRVVPSPEPKEIIETEAIRTLLEARFIVIAAGGGGVPVCLTETGELEGVEAVVDKDLAAERLAEGLGAKIMLFLTNVSGVKLNFGRPNEYEVDKMSLGEAERYFAEGHFLPGSMGPKVKASIDFLENGGDKAIITSLENATQALQGKAGTVIRRG